MARSQFRQGAPRAIIRHLSSRRKVVLITPSPILLLLIMAIAHSQNKIMSPETTKGAVSPLLFSAALLILLIWLIRRFHSNRRGDGGSGDFGGGFIGDGKNNDGDLRGSGD